MDFWKQFPDKTSLEKDLHSDIPVRHVNAHVHTPFSFSAFDSIKQAVEMASREEVAVLGINDFFTAKGYRQWAQTCQEYKIFPLFNIEFVGLSKSDQLKGIRINDPNNPGRIYISGKGMSYPFSLDDSWSNLLSDVQRKSNEQSEAMCSHLNRHLAYIGSEIRLSYDLIREKYTEGIVRERHLAKALRIAVFERYIEDEVRAGQFMQIFGGKAPESPMTNVAGLENEIRARLLKSGGPAFVSESPELFPDLEKVHRLILNGGGIPTYPLLADSVKGGYTEYEENKEKLYNDLMKKGFYSIEFIPGRNSTASLEEYSKFFTEKGFVITYGSEHNTPEMIPVRLKDKSGSELSEILKMINYSGSCILAAHQYLVAKAGEGYLDADGRPKLNRKKEFEVLGRNLLEHFYAK